MRITVHITNGLLFGHNLTSNMSLLHRRGGVGGIFKVSCLHYSRGWSVQTPALYLVRGIANVRARVVSPHFNLFQVGLLNHIICMGSIMRMRMNPLRDVEFPVGLGALFC